MKVNTQQPTKASIGLNVRDRENIMAELNEKVEAEGEDNRLLVLTDPEAMKLIGRIYGQYISESDLANYVSFIKDFDRLLYKYRGNKPLSHEQGEQVEDDDEDDGDYEEAAPRKKKNLTPALDKQKRKESEPLEDTETAPEYVVSSLVSSLKKHLK